MLNIPEGITKRKRLIMKVFFDWIQTSRVEDQLSQKCVMVAETSLFFLFFLLARLRQLTSRMRMDFFTGSSRVEGLRFIGR